MTERRFIQICAISSILAAVAYIGTFIFILLAGLPATETLADVDQYLIAFNGSRGLLVTYGIFGLLGSLFTLPAIIGYMRYLKKEGVMQWIPAVIIFHGVVLLTLAYIIPILIGYYIAPLYVETSVSTLQTTIRLVTKTLIVSEKLLVDIGTILTLLTGITLIGIFDLKQSILPKWLNWLGIVTGVLSLTFIGSFAKGTVGTVFTVLSIVDLVLMLIWMVAIGIIMLLPEKQTATNKSPIA